MSRRDSAHSFFSARTVPKLMLAASVCLVTTLTPGGARAVLIDDFESGPFLLAPAGGPCHPCFLTVTASGTVGGQRTAFLSPTLAIMELGASASSLNIVLGVDPGNGINNGLLYSSPTNFIGDLTDGGTQDRIRILFPMVDDDFFIQPRILGDGLTIPGADLGPVYTIGADDTHLDIPFADFLQPVAFTSAHSLYFFMWGSNGAVGCQINPGDPDCINIQINDISTVYGAFVPEPATATLMLSGLLGLSLLRRWGGR